VPLCTALETARGEAGADADTAPDTELNAALADHLVSGRFVDFQLWTGFEGET
jgi:hypothetical protein